MVQTVRQTIDIPQLVVDMPDVHDCADFPVVVQMPFSMVQTVRRTMLFPQFVLDKVIVVPVVQVERDPHVPSWRRLLCSHGCTRCGSLRVGQLIMALMS